MDQMTPIFDKKKFQASIKNTFIYQTSQIYGGVQGFYDYAPEGCNVMDNIIDMWRNFFIENENMLKIKCPIITMERQLKASGHVDRFNDYLVTDLVTGESFRADHLVESHLENLINDKSISLEKKKEIEDLIQKIDNFGESELDKIIKDFQIKASITNNEISSPRPFNLMFAVNIGPSGNLKGYLRPETAQGIFVNFKELLGRVNGKLPFAVAQIGTACRNEISPRSGLLRVREFEMAEIEHFLDPEDKSHSEFHTVAHLNFNMFTSPNQMSGKPVELLNLGDAVRDKIIANETLGYFMGRIYLFLTAIGVQPERLRFRQHMPNEMAHYACDCWDAECLTSYGWIECVGCADRSAFDLSRHAECSGTKLVAQRQYVPPKKVWRHLIKPVSSKIGPVFKKRAAVLVKHLESLSADSVRALQQQAGTGDELSIDINGENFTVTRDMIEFEEREDTIHIEEYVPNVIEPSFGLGRIFYCVLEHLFAVRPEDENRTYFRLPTMIAPYQFAILPLMAKPELLAVVKRVKEELRRFRIINLVDVSSVSIGRRYARVDSIGVAFSITIDYESLDTGSGGDAPSVTMRDRDSMCQCRVPIATLAGVAIDLANGRLTWEKLIETHPLIAVKEED